MIIDPYDNYKLRRSVGTFINLLGKINTNKILMLPSCFVHGYDIEPGESKTTYTFVFRNYYPKILVDIINIEVKRYLMIAFNHSASFEFMGAPFPIDYYLVKRSI